MSLCGLDRENVQKQNFIAVLYISNDIFWFTSWSYWSLLINGLCMYICGHEITRDEPLVHRRREASAAGRLRVLVLA